MNIRIATLSDLPTLRMLWHDFLVDTKLPYPMGVLDQMDDFTRHLALALAQVPQACFAFLAEVEREPIGFLLYEIQRRALGQPDRYGFVHGIYVHPAYRRQGVSSALTEIACEHGLAQGLTYGEITSAPENPGWQALGFKPYEVRGQAPIAQVLARLDKRRARRAAEQGNGLDHVPLTPEQPEDRHDER